MPHRLVSCLLGGVISVAALAGSCPADENSGVPVLDTTGFWRAHTTIKPPVVKNAEGVRTLEFRAKWLMRGTSLPPADWTSPDFDDSGWARFPGMLNVSPHYHVLAVKSPFVSLECVRGKFTVTDPPAARSPSAGEGPAKAGDLTLSAVYRGGIVVYLNGTEIARGHLRAGGGLERLAEGYPFEKHDPKKPETKHRRLAAVKVPGRLLRKGVNVLAVEAHRAAYDERDVTRDRKKRPSLSWGSCGVVRIRLTSPDGQGVVPNVERPRGFQVWNSDPMLMDSDLDWGDPNETLKPISLVGTRNGTFSGKVVLGSSEAIKGLHAVMSELKRTTGGGRIPASAVAVRYARADAQQEGMARRYTEFPACFGGLEEFPPVEVKVAGPRRGPWSFKPTKSPGVSVVFGAVQPVWVTVNVPADAGSGEYAGTLTLRAGGERPIEVPVRLTVSSFRLPDPHDYVTWVDIIQSPESVALEYDVPLWSDAHFKHLEKSLKLLGSVGNKVVYLHLVAKTNAGNAETMVRWIRQPDGTYTHDFSPLERYLDLAMKHGGRPSVVCLYVHDYHCNKSVGGRWADPQFNKPEDERDKSGRVPVTAVGVDGKTEELRLPAYDDARSEALWQPVIDGVRRRLKARGLEKTMMFGMSSDFHPDEFVVTLFKTLSPGTPWVSQGHAMPTHLHGVPVKYLSGIWQGGKFPDDPSLGRTYGWTRTYTGIRSTTFSSPSGAVLVHFPRNPWWSFPVTAYRLAGEMNIAGQQRGFARLGADFWPVLKDRRGRLGRLHGRYPKTTWRNLDIRSCILSAGPDGAISTQRFEMLREGIQECEARIFIEKAILARTLPDDLAERAQAVLDERIVPMRMGLTLLASGADGDTTWWNWPGLLGYNWYVGSGWQERSKKLYNAAAEVAAALGAN